MMTTNNPKQAPTFAPAPSPAEVRAARERIGYSQTAAAVIYRTLRTWQAWESGDTPMDPAFWELWKHKVGIEPAPCRP